MATSDLCVFLLMSVSSFASPACARASEANFQDRAMSVGATTRHYRVYVPAGWSAKKKWPVILFLHGAGERGDDNSAQARVGIGPAIERNPQSFPCIVVMPQCPTGRWWPEPEMRALALKALDQSIKEFNGDEQRLYLTGLSMGGYGAWSIVESNPGKFAAIAPICGGVRPPARVPIPQGSSDVAEAADPYALVAQKVGNTPVWIFHGAADTVVPVSESRKMAEALKAVSANVRYSEYEGVGHNSWDRAYAEPELLPWIFSQRLESRAKTRPKGRAKS